MRYLIAMLALAGLVVSGFALREHFRTGASPCSINERWDCGAVNHSPFAEIKGVPVAVFGILGYAAIAALLFGAVLLVPASTVRGLKLAPRTHHVVLDTAVSQLRENVGLSTLSLSAIIVSFSLMVAMAMNIFLLPTLYVWAAGENDKLPAPESTEDI